MDKVINHGIPHVGELIFESIDTPELFQCALVSETWKILAENVLIKRWKGKMFEACKNGEAKVVELLLEQRDSKQNGLISKMILEGLHLCGLAVTDTKTWFNCSLIMQAQSQISDAIVLDGLHVCPIMEAKMLSNCT